MRMVLNFLVAIGFVSHAVAAEPKKPVSNWTCDEFLGVEADFQPKVVYFVSGRPKSGKPNSLVDIEGTEKVVPMIIDNCKKTPSDSFMKRLKEAWRAVVADAKKLKDTL